MSIITLIRDDNCATVAVDTQTAFPDGRTCETSKVHLVPHINTVIAARGTGDLLRNVADRLVFATSFDDAVEILQRELPDLVAQLTRVESQDVPPDHSVARGAQELVVVGWSPLANRMVALQFFKMPGEQFQQTELTDFYAAPMTDEFKPDFATPTWRPADADDLVRLARAQIACGRNATPGRPHMWGGRLLVVGVTKVGAQFRTLAHGL